MKSAIRDSKGNSLRPNYRVSDNNSDRIGTVVGLSPPFSVSIEWDDGSEDTVRADTLRHISKTAR